MCNLISSLQFDVGGGTSFIVSLSTPPRHDFRPARTDHSWIDVARGDGIIVRGCWFTVEDVWLHQWIEDGAERGEDGEIQPVASGIAWLTDRK